MASLRTTNWAKPDQVGTGGGFLCLLPQEKLVRGKVSELGICDKLIERWKWVNEELACGESMLLAMGEIMGYVRELLRTSHLQREIDVDESPRFSRSGG